MVCTNSSTEIYLGSQFAYISLDIDRPKEIIALIEPENSLFVSWPLLSFSSSGLVFKPIPLCSKKTIGIYVHG